MKFRLIEFQGVDAKSGAIYCYICDDMVHSRVVDALYLEAILRIEEQYTPFQGWLVHRLSRLVSSFRLDNLWIHILTYYSLK